MVEDTEIPAGKFSRMLQDPQKMFLGNQTGAGTGQKNSPWSDGLHCQLVDIKIAPLRFFKPISLPRPFWRIDDDDLSLIHI